jgi:hypothetical protein
MAHRVGVIGAARPGTLGPGDFHEVAVRGPLEPGDFQEVARISAVPATARGYGSNL